MDFKPLYPQVCVESCVKNISNEKFQAAFECRTEECEATASNTCDNVVGCFKSDMSPKCQSLLEICQSDPTCNQLYDHPPKCSDECIESACYDVEKWNPVYPQTCVKKCFNSVGNDKLRAALDCREAQCSADSMLSFLS